MKAPNGETWYGVKQVPTEGQWRSGIATKPNPKAARLTRGGEMVDLYSCLLCLFSRRFLSYSLGFLRFSQRSFVYCIPRSSSPTQ